MQITDHGERVATIVVPDEASQAEWFAAQELQTYLQKISGGKLRIVSELLAGEGDLDAAG